MEKIETLTPATRRILVNIAASASFADIEKPGIFLYRFVDIDGRELEDPSASNRSVELGYYRYVSFAASPPRQRFILSVPEGAVRLIANVKDWQSRIQNSISEFSITQLDEKAVSDFSGVSPEAPEPIDGTRVRMPLIPGELYALHLDHIGGKDGESIVSLSFADEDGNLVLPPGELSVHPDHGAHVVLKSTRDVGPTSVEFVVPHDAVGVTVSGVTSEGGGRAYVREPELERLAWQSRGEESIRTWLEGVARGDDLVIIHTQDAPFESGASTNSRSGELALGLNARGWRVVFVPSENASVKFGRAIVAEGLLQLAESDLPSVLEHLLARELTGHRAYLCSNRADFAAVSVQDRLQDRGWSTVYESCWETEDLARSGEAGWFRPVIEQRFAERADGLVAASPRLKARLSCVVGRTDVALIADALPDELVDFGNAVRSERSLATFRGRRVVGYHGTVDEKLLDWRTLMDAARRLPDLKLEIIADCGVAPANVLLPSNVELVEDHSPGHAWSRMRLWDLGVAPFTRTRLALGLGSRLIGEYAALGLRTVSSSIGNPHNVPGLREYSGVDELVIALREELTAELSEEFHAECRVFADGSRSSQRVAEFEEYMRGLNR